MPDEDDLYTIEEIMPDGSSPASNSYKNIAFVIASPGRNLTQQFTDPNSDNEITLYDPGCPTTTRAPR